MRKDIQERIMQILMVYIETKDLHGDLKLTEIGISSMNYIQAIVQLENEYLMEFDDKALQGDYFSTISEMAEYVERMALSQETSDNLH